MNPRAITTAAAHALTNAPERLVAPRRLVRSEGKFA